MDTKPEQKNDSPAQLQMPIKSKQSCRCDKTLLEITGLLQEIRGLRASALSFSFCPHLNISERSANLAPPSGQCCICCTELNKYLTSKIKHFDDIQKQYQQWILKVNQVLLALCKIKTICLQKGHAYSSNSKELEKLLRELKGPLMIPREIKIGMFSTHITSENLLTESKLMLEAILAELEIESDRKGSLSSETKTSVTSLPYLEDKAYRKSQLFLDQKKAGYELTLQPTREMIEVEFQSKILSTLKETPTVKRAMMELMKKLAAAGVLKTSSKQAAEQAQKIINEGLVEGMTDNLKDTIKHLSERGMLAVTEKSMKKMLSNFTKRDFLSPTSNEIEGIMKKLAQEGLVIDSEKDVKDVIQKLANQGVVITARENVTQIVKKLAEEGFILSPERAVADLMQGNLGDRIGTRSKSAMERGRQLLQGSKTHLKSATSLGTSVASKVLREDHKRSKYKKKHGDQLFEESLEGKGQIAGGKKKKSSPTESGKGTARSLASGVSSQKHVIRGKSSSSAEDKRERAYRMETDGDTDRDKNNKRRTKYGKSKDEDDQQDIKADRNDKGYKRRTKYGKSKDEDDQKDIKADTDGKGDKRRIKDGEDGYEHDKHGTKDEKDKRIKGGKKKKNENAGGGGKELFKRSKKNFSSTELLLRLIKEREKEKDKERNQREKAAAKEKQLADAEMRKIIALMNSQRINEVLQPPEVEIKPPTEELALEFSLPDLTRIPADRNKEMYRSITEMVKGSSVKPFNAQKYFSPKTTKEVAPILFKVEKHFPSDEDLLLDKSISPQSSSSAVKSAKGGAAGVLKYALSNPEFIKNGITILPSVQYMRKMNIYKMVPSKPKYDWFLRHRHEKMLFYESGELLAEIDDDGCGRWFYKNGIMALNCYQAEDTIAGKRYVLYSSGCNDINGNHQPLTVLAIFDQIGSGIIYDHFGNIRLKFNQSEGIILDSKIAPECHWKWHSLNDDYPVYPVYKDIQPTYEELGPELDELMKNNKRIKPSSIQKIEAEEGLLRVEISNVEKERAKRRMTSKESYQIRMKTFKINKQLSIQIISQSNIYIRLRQDEVSLKLNIGMKLSNEIIDVDTLADSQVITSYDRPIPRSDSAAEIRHIIKNVKKQAGMKALYHSKLRG